MISRFTPILTNFIQSSSDIRLIPLNNNNNDHPSTIKTPVTCVLDSSFNPPHVAHAKLVTMALDHYANSRIEASILLLLATNNADKPSQDIANLTHRLEMMQLMGQDIAKEYPKVSISLGITKYARFVDKLDALCSLNYPTKYSFLVGFDTFIRILDGKYYDPNVPLALNLAPIMDRATFVVLSRRPDTTCNTPASMTANIENQLQFVNKLRQGQIPELPSVWANNIHVLEGTAETDQVSSSIVREQVSKGKIIDGSIVSNSIARYIEKNNLYI